MRGRKRYELVVFDDRIQRRAALRETLNNMPFEVSLYAAHSVTDGLEFCRENSQLDFVVIGTVGESSHSAAAKRIGAEFKCIPPMVALLSPREQNPVDLADVASAFDAAITEPFSVNQVQSAVDRVVTSERYKRFRTHQENGGLKTLLYYAKQMIEVRGALQRLKKQSSFQALRDWRKTAARMKQLRDSVDEEELVRLLEATVRDAEPYSNIVAPTRRSKVAIHPARVVHRIIRTRGISLEVFKRAVKLPDDVIDQFLAEKAPMTQEIAEGLARVLGQTAEYWMNSAGKV